MASSEPSNGSAHGCIVNRLYPPGGRMWVPRYNPRMASAKDSFSQSGQNPTIQHNSGQSLRTALDDLQNSEAKLRWLIDTIPAVAWYGLPDGSKQFLNKRWRE